RAGTVLLAAWATGRSGRDASAGGHDDHDMSCCADVGSPPRVFQIAQMLRDDHPLRLGCALINLRRARVAEEALGDRTATVAGRREHLHRLVRRTVRGL